MNIFSNYIPNKCITTDDRGPAWMNNPNTSAKTYWSILESFYNDIKVPLIPSKQQSFI